MLSPLDENELAAAWRRAAGPDGKVPVKSSNCKMYLSQIRKCFDGKVLIHISV